MDTELERRIADLRVAVPDPPPELRTRALAAAHRATHPRRHRLARSRARTGRVLRIAMPVTGAIAIAGVLVLALPRGTTRHSGAVIQALSGPQVATDRLPTWVANDPAVLGNAINPASTRLAWAGFGRRFYLATGKATRMNDQRIATGSPTVCVINAVARTPSARFHPGRPGTISCQLLEVFRRSGLTVTVAGSRRTVRLVGVVPDGFTALSIFGRVLPIRDNFFTGTFVVGPRTPRFELATVSGPTGNRRLEGDRVLADPADSSSPGVRTYGVQPTRGLDRPYEPTLVNVEVELRRGYDTVTVGGRSGRARGHIVNLRGVPASPFRPLTLRITGPAGTTKLEVDTTYLGRAHDMLNPYRPSRVP